MIECTDRQFLPPAMVEKIEALGGRGKLDARLTALKQLVRPCGGVQPGREPGLKARPAGGPGTM